MSVTSTRKEISNFLGFSVPTIPMSFTTHSIAEEPSFRRLLITYTGDEGDSIPAYLLLPHGTGPFAAVLVHHQHKGQRYLGKSEVVGLLGHPLQAFGPALARNEIAVLAPDS